MSDRSPDRDTGRSRIGILLSGRGSNFLALAEAIRKKSLRAEIALVATNEPGAPGLIKAQEMGFPVETIPHRGHRRREHDGLMVEALRDHAVDWVCLAGYMRLLTPVFVDAFPNRILNIHPSLLPAFPGLNAQQQAWDYGVAISGCTVHLVDKGMDTGPIVEQAAVPIGSLAGAREAATAILEQEHRLYPKALQKMLSGPWHLEGRRVVFHSRVCHPPVPRSEG